MMSFMEDKRIKEIIAGIEAIEKELDAMSEKNEAAGGYEYEELSDASNLLAAAKSSLDELLD